MGVAFDHALVVGAGISGLLAAQAFLRDGRGVTVLEKGRRPGGRMATKALDDALYDHGAQFITTRDPRFRERVETWLGKELVRPWYKGPRGNMRYVGVDGINRVAAYVGQQLDVRASEKVTYIHFADGQWKVTTKPHGEDTARHYTGDFLLLTAPVPQSLALLDESNIQIDFDAEDELRRITYTKCLTVMARLDGPAGLSNPGAMDLNHRVLRWLGDNSVKGLSPIPGCVTLNSSPEYAEKYWDAPDEVRIPPILAAAKPFLKSDVVDAVCHRWGFSEPKRLFHEKRPFRTPYFLDAEHRVAMCGDGFGGGRIEAAGLSGLELAEAVLRPI